MKKILDVNLQRKIRKKRLTKKYFKVIILFFSIFLVIFAAWQISLKHYIFSNKDSKFPIVFLGDGILGFEETKKGFCVLTNAQFNFYEKDAKLLKNSYNNSLKANVKGFYNNNNILFYEKGSKNFNIQNEKQVVFSGELENDAIFAKTFKNGMYAFVTREEGYLCSLVVYDKKNEQIFSWSFAESLIVDFNISEKEDGIVVCTTGVKEGLLKTFVYELNFSSNEEKLKKELDGFMPFIVKKVGSVIILVGDTKVVYFDDGGKILNSIEFGKRLKNFIVNDYGCFIAYLNNLESAEFNNLIVSYDKYGNLINKKETQKQIKDIKYFNSDVIFLTDDEIIKTNSKLKELKKTKNDFNVEKFIYKKPYIYFVSMNKVNRILLN